MRTKVASFFIFFQELSNKKKIKALRPKMTKIASRGGSCLKQSALEVHGFSAGPAAKKRFSFRFQKALPVYCEIAHAWRKTQKNVLV